MRVLFALALRALEARGWDVLDCTGGHFPADWDALLADPSPQRADAVLAAWLPRYFAAPRAFDEAVWAGGADTLAGVCLYGLVFALALRLEAPRRLPSPITV